MASLTNGPALPMQGTPNFPGMQIFCKFQPANDKHWLWVKFNNIDCEWVNACTSNQRNFSRKPNWTKWSFHKSACSALHSALNRNLECGALPFHPRTSGNLKSVSEKIAVMVVTSSADRPQICSERVRNLSGFNRTKLKQDGGNPVRLIQDLLQAHVMHVSKIDDLRRNHQQHVPHELV